MEYPEVVREGIRWWYKADVAEAEGATPVTYSFGTTLAGDTVIDEKVYKKYMMLPASEGGCPEKFVKDMNIPLALLIEGSSIGKRRAKGTDFRYNTILNIGREEEYEDFPDNKFIPFPDSKVIYVGRYVKYPTFNYPQNFEYCPYRMIEQNGTKFLLCYWDMFVTADPLEYYDYWPEEGQYSIRGYGASHGLICSPHPNSPIFNASDFLTPNGPSRNYTIEPVKEIIPVLTYVTDSENNVIFEAAGGDKPWEHIGAGAVKAEEIPSLTLSFRDGLVKAVSSDRIALSVTSLQGAPVMKASGFGLLDADTSALLPGVYVAEARSGKTVRRLKFIVR